MKGVIIKCLAELVSEKFGKEKWADVLTTAGMAENTVFLAGQDLEDTLALKIVDSVCKALNISLEQAADAFGEYWVIEFAPKMYSSQYRGSKNAKEFLLKMDTVHANMTIDIKNARPPRFEYNEVDEKTLIMTYKSHRGLIVFFIGLIKGVGIYFRENLVITKLDEQRIKIQFNGK